MVHLLLHILVEHSSFCVVNMDDVVESARNSVPTLKANSQVAYQNLQVNHQFDADISLGKT